MASTPNYLTTNPALPLILGGQERDIQTQQLLAQQQAAQQKDAQQRALASFYATPNPSTPEQQAVNFATSTPGLGSEAMSLATEQRKTNVGIDTEARKAHETHLEKMMERVKEGDFAAGAAYADQFNLTEGKALFSSPGLALQMHYLLKEADKISPKDPVYDQAFVKNALAVAPKLLVDPKTGQQRDFKEAFPDIVKAAMQQTPAPVAKGRGATPAGNSIQRTFTGNDGYLYATMRQPGPNGEIITKQLTDDKGQPIRSGDIAKFAGQVYLKSADQLGGGSIPAAQEVAGQLYKPAPPSAVVRRYVPGKGFVSVP